MAILRACFLARKDPSILAVVYFETIGYAHIGKFFLCIQLFYIEYAFNNYFFASEFDGAPRPLDLSKARH